jgi:hypothetical protein
MNIHIYTNIYKYIPISPFTTSVSSKFRIGYFNDFAHTPGRIVLPVPGGPYSKIPPSEGRSTHIYVNEMVNVYIYVY